MPTFLKSPPMQEIRENESKLDEYIMKNRKGGYSVGSSHSSSSSEIIEDSKESESESIEIKPNQMFVRMR